jgi:hypothetical protein
MRGKNFHDMVYRKILISVLLITILAGACASTTTSKQTKETYVKAHPALNQNIKEAMLKGEAVVGMTTEQVMISCGSPNLISSKRDERGQYYSLWSYRRYTVIFEEDNKVIEVK